MTYAILAFCGTILAFAGGLWYLVRKGGTDASTIATLDAYTKDQQAKVKTLDDRIVDSEYAVRAAEKARNAKIVAANDASAAGELLARGPRTDGSPAKP